MLIGNAMLHVSKVMGKWTTWLADAPFNWCNVMVTAHSLLTSLHAIRIPYCTYVDIQKFNIKYLVMYGKKIHERFLYRRTNHILTIAWVFNVHGVMNLVVVAKILQEEIHSSQNFSSTHKLHHDGWKSNSCINSSAYSCLMPLSNPLKAVFKQPKPCLNHGILVLFEHGFYLKILKKDWGLLTQRCVAKPGLEWKFCLCFCWLRRC